MFEALKGDWPLTRGRWRSLTRRKQLGRREQLYRDQCGICHYCCQFVDYGDWTIDHMQPRSRGGSNLKDNIVGACRSCNEEKGSRTVFEFVTSSLVSLNAPPQSPQATSRTPSAATEAVSRPPESSAASHTTDSPP